ncbi:unnamed protein product [Ilex paraguariensis]|uniref:Uncharacterized protein n=1 Tax=Ilex paraguariensis TaxID=185542 RepID=A0ABC8S3T7_9AQUA
MKGTVQFGAWLRAPVGKGLKSTTGQKVDDDKLPVVKNCGISLEGGLESLEQSHKIRKAVNEPSNLGVNDSIFGVEEIPIIESISGRQNIESGMAGELMGPSIN